MLSFLLGIAFGVFLRDLFIADDGSVSRKILNRFLSMLTGD